MYPGHYQAPQPYGAPPAHPYPPPQGPPAGYPPQPGHYAPPVAAPGYPAAYPQQHHYPPPAAAPYGAPPQPHGAYPPPAAAPYGAPPAAHPPYGAPPVAHPPYGAPPVAHPPPYGAPPQPVAHSSPYPQAAYPPQHVAHSSPYAAYHPPAVAPPPMVHVPQQMYAPVNVPPPPPGWNMVQNTHIPAPTNFQLSNCTGRKRALLIGVNYFRQKGELRGCINDVRNIKKFISRFGFREEDIVTLTDDQADPTRIPTRVNIISGMQWLVRDARPNDSFFLHFSGHGGQTADMDGDEDDGNDNTIYPVDHQRAGVIVDDMMHDIMVKPLPAGCRLTAIMDCCHSGSALDLPFTYSTSGQLKDQSVLQGVGSGLMGVGMSYLRGDLGGVKNSIGNIGKKIGRPGNRQRIVQTKSSPSDCIMFSGCKDNQTSADTHETGQVVNGMTGAMTFSFITALTANPHQTYLQLLNSIRDILRTKYSQKPQLSSSHPVDLNLVFTM
ncbi:Ca(2+)-dependent cysteine protease [Mortierella sp. AD032]|nr:Ca(2+)-dependent cysteine protease [Mortierella sp. AD032]